MSPPASFSTPVLRFAPSPNGPLHIGHALSALTGFDMARRLGGRFLLRIEDIDQTRVRPEYVQGIFDDLAWLGICWEEPVLHQSQHLAAYTAAAQKLSRLGVLYPCFATRSEIVAAGDPAKLDPDGALLYPGLWRNRPRADVEERLARGEPHAMRLDMGRALSLAEAKLAGHPLTFTECDEAGRRQLRVCTPQLWGDVIILRKETPSSYLIAVVVDDARQGITHVTRGRDLFAATDVQRLLHVLLDLPEPLYHHHRLMTDFAGQKLSKSAGAPALAQLRTKGVSPHEVRRLVGLPHGTR